MIILLLKISEVKKIIYGNVKVKKNYHNSFLLGGEAIKSLLDGISLFKELDLFFNYVYLIRIYQFLLSL